MDTDYIRETALQLSEAKSIFEAGPIIEELHREYQLYLKQLGAEKTEDLFPQNKRKTVEEVRAGSETYRLQLVKCGKKDCPCTAGKLHGPYWYAFWSAKGKTRSRYIGKRLPPHVDAARRAAEASDLPKPPPSFPRASESDLAQADGRIIPQPNSGAGAAASD